MSKITVGPQTQIYKKTSQRANADKSSTQSSRLKSIGISAAIKQGNLNSANKLYAAKEFSETLRQMSQTVYATDQVSCHESLETDIGCNITTFATHELPTSSSIFTKDTVIRNSHMRSEELGIEITNSNTGQNNTGTPGLNISAPTQQIQTQPLNPLVESAWNTIKHLLEHQKPQFWKFQIASNNERSTELEIELLPSGEWSVLVISEENERKKSNSKSAYIVNEDPILQANNVKDDSMLTNQSHPDLHQLSADLQALLRLNRPNLDISVKYRTKS